MLRPPIDPTTRQVKVHLLHSAYTSNPNIFAVFSSPCISYCCEFGLDFDQELSGRIQDIDSIANADEDIAIVCNTESVR